ncbi:SDR family NAD(P)-dependent oxidoreductase [Nitrospina gracilis]|uniref:SDR family NAD(P)-dependent oxidoreductase n=1 Tax=Nitrospina gracilis TaxID=35801 RepID=UPI001F21B8D3|nr:SDR family oxidoreductase [Nitrospina gracilis]MCF8720190.1 meso-butanediol dehydrogenase/(S,S)-butanediol dehydrogenase/diacetyl reductase [Nitrospina gracilis Nb-211]
MRLENKTVIITGGGTGIGFACAELFHKEGARLALFGRRKELLKAAAKRLGENVLAVPGDITRQDDVDMLVELTLKEFGQIDVLVNNAGTLGGWPLHQTENDAWDEVLNVNLRGLFLLTRRVLAHMVERKSGSIVHISSILGLVAVPQTGAYNVSKGALNQLSRSIAVEYGPLNIRSNALCPGMVETDMTEALRDNKELMEDWKEHYYPMRRFAKPEEVANACLFLASDESSFITGTVLPVDGGFTAM